MHTINIKFSNNNYERIKSFYNSILLKKNNLLTDHWKTKIERNLNSFEFIGDNIIKIHVNNHSGLDNYYEECFTKNKIRINKSIKFRIKKYFKLFNIHSNENFDAKIVLKYKNCKTL